MGRPVVHWELWSENPEKVSEFYRVAQQHDVDVPGVGQFSLFEDPDGRVLGMWKQQG